MNNQFIKIAEIETTKQIYTDRLVKDLTKAGYMTAVPADSDWRIDVLIPAPPIDNTEDDRK